MTAEMEGTGPIGWTASTTRAGVREYELTFRVKSDDPKDGPKVIRSAAGMPLPGSSYAFGNDIDSWAICTYESQVRPVVSQENTRFWDVTLKFSTEVDGIQCENVGDTNPLMQPAEVSGSYVKYTREVNTDRHGKLILSTSHEMFRGPQVEFDHNRPTVRIGMNVSTLQLGTLSTAMDAVNEEPLWGMPKRCVKLSGISWTRKKVGNCDTYYTLVLDFDVAFDTFDRKILNEGTKVLNGKWKDGTWVLLPVDKAGQIQPDPKDPRHFIRYQDQRGNVARVVLDEMGLPVDSPLITDDGLFRTGKPLYIKVERYEEFNFLLLGIPVGL